MATTKTRKKPATKAAREKASKASNCKKRGLAGPIFQEDEMYFSEPDLLKMELAQAKVLNAAQAVKLKQADMETLKRNAERKMEIYEQELVALKNQMRHAEVGLRELQMHIAGCYDVDIKRMTYDDETGKITIHDPPEEEGSKDEGTDPVLH